MHRFGFPGCPLGSWLMCRSPAGFELDVPGKLGLVFEKKSLSRTTPSKKGAAARAPGTHLQVRGTPPRGGQPGQECVHVAGVAAARGEGLHRAGSGEPPPPTPLPPPKKGFGLAYATLGREGRQTWRASGVSLASCRSFSNLGGGESESPTVGWGVGVGARQRPLLFPSRGCCWPPETVPEDVPPLVLSTVVE